MGVGPAFAIPKVLEQTSLSKDEIDFYEINEAFASQAVYSVLKVGIPFEKVNVNGARLRWGIRWAAVRTLFLLALARAVC